MADGRAGCLLLPFAASVLWSLLWFAPQEEPRFSGLLVKCLPVSGLLGYMASAERGRREANLVVAALAASLVGDAFLVWPDDYFVGGVASFGVAQGLYATAFGSEGASLPLGAALHALNAVVMAATIPSLRASSLRAAVALYSVAITSMLWRALDRARLRRDVPGARRLCTAAGAFLFCASDLSIVGLQLGGAAPRATAQLVVLSTYYAAQLLLVLGSSEGLWPRSPGRRSTADRR